jgi:hypothetical protein
MRLIAYYRIRHDCINTPFSNFLIFKLINPLLEKAFEISSLCRLWFTTCKWLIKYWLIRIYANKDFGLHKLVLGGQGGCPVHNDN